MRSVFEYRKSNYGVWETYGIIHSLSYLFFGQLSHPLFPFVAFFFSNWAALLNICSHRCTSVRRCQIPHLEYLSIILLESRYCHCRRSPRLFLVLHKSRLPFEPMEVITAAATFGTVIALSVQPGSGIIKLEKAIQSIKTAPCKIKSLQNDFDLFRSLLDETARVAELQNKSESCPASPEVVYKALQNCESALAYLTGLFADYESSRQRSKPARSWARVTSPLTKAKIEEARARVLDAVQALHGANAINHLKIKYVAPTRNNSLLTPDSVASMSQPRCSTQINQQRVICSSTDLGFSLSLQHSDQDSVIAFNQPSLCRKGKVVSFRHFRYQTIFGDVEGTTIFRRMLDDAKSGGNSHQARGLVQAETIVVFSPSFLQRVIYWRTTSFCGHPEWSLKVYANDEDSILWDLCVNGDILGVQNALSAGVSPYVLRSSEDYMLLRTTGYTENLPLPNETSHLSVISSRTSLVGTLCLCVSVLAH